MATAAASPTIAQRGAARPPINPWIIAMTVTLATFMELLDTSIANVSHPTSPAGWAVPMTK